MDINIDLGAIGVPGIFAIAGLILIIASKNGRIFQQLRPPDPDHPVPEEDKGDLGTAGIVVILMAVLFAVTGVFG